MKYSLFSIILALIINAQLLEAACEDHCADNFPPTCKSTCGCIRLAADKNMIMDIDEDFFQQNKPENYFKPTLSWSNCTHVTPSSCPEDKKRSIKLTFDPISNETTLGKISNGFIGSAGSGSFLCNSTTNQWESTSGEMYLWTCAP